MMNRFYAAIFAGTLAFLMGHGALAATFNGTETVLEIQAEVARAAEAGETLEDIMQAAADAGLSIDNVVGALASVRVRNSNGDLVAAYTAEDITTAAINAGYVATDVVTAVMQRVPGAVQGSVVNAVVAADPSLDRGQLNQTVAALRQGTGTITVVSTTPIIVLGGSGS